LTRKVSEDWKIIDDDAQHLDINDQRNLYTEHLRLLFGGEKEEDEDEEEY